MLIGLTGGIATGKSTLCRMLAQGGHFVVFDADAYVHELFVSDEEIKAAVCHAFDLPVPAPECALQRAPLREAIFADPAKRRRLESIVHPAVRRRWQCVLADCQAEKKDFLADIPLLFETGAATFFDATVVVASSPDTQRARLAARGVPPVLLEAMLASQWPIGQKIEAADHVIWNDGSPASLERQASLLLETFIRLAA